MDYLIELVGDYGKFQFKATFIVGLISALSSACIYATIFIAAEPDLNCVKRTYINNKTESETLLHYEQKCLAWSGLVNNITNETHSFECYFDKSLYDKTIINEWSLVCDRQYWAGLTQTVHIFGSIFGFCGGVFGDKYGRRKAVLVFAFLLTISLLVSQFFLLPQFNLSIEIRYIIFSISQFLIGLLVNCLYCTSYVLLMEFTTEKYRTQIANLNSYIYVVGELIVFAVYYFSRDWHVLNWFIGIFSLIIFLLSFYLIESPIWLVSIGKNDEAICNLRKIAKSNGKKDFQINITLIESFKYQQKLLDDEHNSLAISNSKDKNRENKIEKENDAQEACNIDIFMLKEIFTPKETFIKTTLLFYIWAALMLLYYGISLGVTSVDLVDPYLMYFLSCIAELIGYVVCYVNDIFGRKKSMFGFFFVTTLMYSFIAYISEFTSEIDESSYSLKAILLMIFGLIGKCAVSGSYHIAYIYTAELYPTTTRNTAVLFLTCVGGFSSLIAPQINTLKTLVWNPMPYIIYSICALLGCLSVLYLPETHKKLDTKK